MGLAYQPENERITFDTPEGASQGGRDAPTRSTVTGSIEDLDAVLKRLAGYVEAMQSIEDYINGSRPRPAPAPAPGEKEIADSLINKMQQRRRTLVRLVDEVERSIQHINEGLRS
jgi:hypothetical protein